MHVLHLSREEAAWRTPATMLLRSQLAYLELKGQEQRWGDTRLDLIQRRIEELERGNG